MRRQWRNFLFVAIAVAGFSWASGAESAPKEVPSSGPNATALRDEGTALLRRGNARDAVPKLRAAAELDPTRWEFLDSLLEAYIRTGEYGGRKELEHERAAHLRKRLVNLFRPTRARAMELGDMGVIYQKINMLAAAERCFGDALALHEKRKDLEYQAWALSYLASLYRVMGAYAKAEPLFQRALAIYEKRRGPQHPDTATSLNNLASLYQVMGAYAKAEPLFQRALAIWEKAPGPQRAEAATSLNDLALLFQLTGAYAKAEPLYRRALANCEKIRGPEHPDTAITLDNLAGLYLAMGEYRKAESIFQRALAIREKALGSQHPDTALTLNNLALLYQTMGAYAKAEALFQRALSINENTSRPRQSETAIALNNLALLYEAMGAYAKAEPLFKQALAMHERALGPFHPTTARICNCLASLYVAMGDCAKAEPLFQRALVIDEKALGPLHPDTATSLSNMATLYEAMGDYAKAEPLQQRALAIREKAVGPQHSDTAEALNNLAALYERMGDYAKAEPLQLRALAIREKALGPQHPDTARALSHLASLYLGLGAYAKAEPLFQRALAIDEKVLGPQHPENARTLSLLAVLYEAKGDCAKAEPLYRRALAIREKALGPLHPETAASLGDVAFLDIFLGKSAEALELARRAEEANTAYLGNILSFTSEQQRLAFQRTFNPFNLAATLGSAPEAAAAVLRNKGVVLDSLLEDRLLADASQDAAHRKVIDQIRGAKQRLTQLLLAVPKDFSAEAVQRRDAEREARAREVEQLEGGLARAVAGLGRARRASTITIEQVQGALASGQALVEFLSYRHYLGKRQWEPRYSAVVIASGGETRWVALGTAAEIEKNVRTYEKSVRDKTDETTLRTTLRALYGQLWTPIEKALAPGIKTIILCPDGDLNFVSFATLMDSDEHFLAERYSIRYVASGRDLLREIAPSASKLMAIFGNPDFGGEMKLAANRAAAERSTSPRTAELRDFDGVSLPALPGTEAECEALRSQTASLGTETRMFLGAAATEAQLRQVNSPRILHLATHGFFLPETGDPQAGSDLNGSAMQPFTSGTAAEGIRVVLKNPMHRSGLALVGAQRTLEAWAKSEAPPTDNDGIVTAEEVGGLKLQGTWLVTLSACDTGAGEARAGEGVMGLRRGFIQAGAQNLLMTLWPISDDTTVKIMLDFYARALKSGDAPGALAETQSEWLVKLRNAKGLLKAVSLAGPFIMSSQGKP